jgi:hypothetical protein
MCGAQSNIYPADAAAAWPAIEEAAARMGGLRIGAPSAAGCGGGPLCVSHPPPLVLGPTFPASRPSIALAATFQNPQMRWRQWKSYPQQSAGQPMLGHYVQAQRAAPLAVATSDWMKPAETRFMQCGCGPQVHARLPQPLRLAGRLLRQLQRLPGGPMRCKPLTTHQSALTRPMSTTERAS